jgi:hypothetical protein
VAGKPPRTVDDAGQKPNVAGAFELSEPDPQEMR